MVIATQLTDPVTFHGEGAVWSPTWGGLRCVDMFAGDVLDIAADGSVTRHHLGDTVCLVRPINSERSIVASEREVVIWHEAANTLEHLTGPVVPSGVRLNEGGCTPAGDLLIGSVAWNTQPGAASLYRVGGNGAALPILDGVTISNGLGFSPDASTLYYNDSASGRVDAFDVASDGSLSHQRAFAAIETGGPDGLWVDALGGVWVAVYGAGAVHHYLPDGSLQDVVTVNARHVTSCTFGGPELSTLYITTSRENIADGDDLLAGSIFVADAGVAGLAVLPFVPTHSAPEPTQKEAP